MAIKDSFLDGAPSIHWHQFLFAWPLTIAGSIDGHYLLS